MVEIGGDGGWSYQGVLHKSDEEIECAPCGWACN